MELRPEWEQALEFLAQGPDEMDREVKDMGHAAAVIIFAELARHGLAKRDPRETKIVWSITPAGLEAIGFDEARP